MDCLLQGTDDFAAAYLDDLVVYSDTWEAHCHHLRQMLQRLSNNGLTAKPAKCQLGMQKCIYLGHVVDNGQVCPEESKLKAVETSAVPTTKNQVRAFLGLIGNYRRFIPDYATLATPLTDLTRKSASSKVEWTVHCDRAFQELKHPISYTTRSLYHL